VDSFCQALTVLQNIAPEKISLASRIR
jgi:hypothetical protein